MQENFIQKVKDINYGKDKKFAILTMGCQLNENDSEKIAGMLTEMGYTEISDYMNADFIVFNTCCVRENAEDRLFGKIGEIKKLKENKDVILAIGGCMMQEEIMVEKIKKSYPYVDIIFGTHTMQKLPEDIYKILTTKKKIRDILDIDGEIYEGLPIKRTSNYKALVTIMYGCNNFCTYCIVPYVRGRERSRKPEKILEEVQALAKEGYKEITLLGQNVNSYKGNEDIKNFSDLLNEVCKINGIERVNFVSPHPKDFTDDVIKAIADNQKISRIIHLPLQSGNTKVLKEMNRRYTKEQYLELVNKMKNGIPDVVFSTDIIVGFPGETDEEFEDTLDVVRKVNFEQVYMFIYSPREGTIAAKREDQIPEKIKHIRFNKLKDLVESQIKINNEKYIGTTQRILVEGKSKNNDNKMTGRTSTNKVVVFDGDDEEIGKIINLEIIEDHMWYLEGKKIVNEYSNLDTAIEIMGYKIANCVKMLEKDESYKSELELLNFERDQMYNGNTEIIDKIINIYGKDIKDIYNKK